MSKHVQDKSWCGEQLRVDCKMLAQYLSVLFSKTLIYYVWDLQKPHRLGVFVVVWGWNCSVRLTVLRNAVSRVNPSSESPAERILPLELAWALTPFPKTLLDESIN